jgi:hypothetical protein
MGLKQFLQQFEILLVKKGVPFRAYWPGYCRNIWLLD